jgi:peptide/nickel transport system substrate-binding protein
MKVRRFLRYLVFSSLSLAIIAGAAWASGGGILKVGAQPSSTLDPHFAASITDIMINEQLYHHLTFISPDNRPVADLATKWETTDGKVWTFHLKSGVKFSTGQPVTARDVVFSFDRLRDPKVGAPTVKLYDNIDRIEAVNDTTVRFTLRNSNPEFPADAGDYHSCIIPAGTTDPGKTRIGSGAFVIDSYFPEDRIVLKPNSHFAGKDAQGNALPKVDKIQFIFSPDMGGQVEALRGGELHFLGGLTTQFAEIVKNDPHTKLLTNDSNMHWAIHMRSDKGHVAADPRIREALKLGTDHQAIIDAVRPGLASVGSGFTPMGPAYGEYFLSVPPKTDTAKAQKLLAEAGYPDGLKISLVAQNQLDVIPIATVWKEQMAKIGVDVDIQVIPSDVYYGEGENSWLKCEFGITDWGSRATPVTYFNLAYLSDGPWNGSHWQDAEFDKLTHEVDQEMDFTRRKELYHQLQTILIERGPVIVPYFEKAVVGVAANLEGVEIPSDWARARFWNAGFSK